MAVEVAMFFEFLLLHHISHCVVDDVPPSSPDAIGLVQGSDMPNMAKRLAAIGNDIR